MHLSQLRTLEPHHVAALLSVVPQTILRGGRLPTSARPALCVDPRPDVVCSECRHRPQSPDLLAHLGIASSNAVVSAQPFQAMVYPLTPAVPQGISSKGFRWLERLHTPTSLCR